jgi:hypothetical protein
MIDTTLTTAAKDAVEQAKDVAHETWSGVAHALRPEKKRRRRLSRGLLVVLFGVGVASALAWYVRRRPRQRTDFDVAPDSFGAAVMEERMAGMSGREPLATPGA